MSTATTKAYNYIQTSDNKVNNSFLEDSLQHVAYRDSVFYANCPVSSKYLQAYVEPKFEIYGLAQLQQTQTSMPYLNKNAGPRSAWGFMENSGFIFALLLIFFMYFMFSLRGKLDRMVQSVWSSVKLERFYNEKELRSPIFFWLVYLSMSLSLTLPLLHNRVYILKNSEFFEYIPKTVWGITVAIMLIYLAYFFLAYVFFFITNQRKHYNYWFISRGSIMWAVAVLYTLLFGLTEAFSIQPSGLMFVYVAIYSVAYLKFLLHTYYMVRERGLSLSVWILYLCALEIFPTIAVLSFVWGVITN